VRNESLGIAMGGTTGDPKPTFYPVHLYGKDGKPNNQMVAAYAALTGKTVNIADAYAEEGFDFSGNAEFRQEDRVPLQGVPHGTDEGPPGRNHRRASAHQQHGSRGRTKSGLSRTSDPAPGGIACVSGRHCALPTGSLIIQLEELFKSFIELINKAIDEKSAYTGGHCKRVPELTMMLAEAVNETSEGPLRDFNMSDKDRYELEIAGLLHDCGKVTTPVQRRGQGDQAGKQSSTESVSWTRVSRC